jgi:hypothetical protein
MRQAYHAESAPNAEGLLTALAVELGKAYPRAVASMREGLAETLTILRLGVPPTLTRTLRSTNTIESMIGCRQHSKNVERWRDGTIALRWCAAGMVEAGHQFRRVNGHLHLPKLRAALDAHRQDVELPALVWDENRRQWREPDHPWGELRLRSARPVAGGRWTDGSGRDRRGLKHRADGETRRVPCAPPLTRLLRDHLAMVAGQAADPLFQGVQGRPLATITYRRAWERRARQRCRTRATALSARAGPTTYDTDACPPGSTGEWAQPKWQSGPATASRCCSASMPSASTVKTRSPSAVSPPPWTATEMD